MSKIIKKKIKRSIPVVLILILVSSLVTGFAFNFNVRLFELPKELGSKIRLGINLPTVKADMASTTVTVRNAPPLLAGVAESPTSASTTPVNEGGFITFLGTGNDPEDQNYYFIVCSTNQASSTNGGSPTCVAGATTFCMSGSTLDNTQASCTYTNVTSVSETQNWYAFACDSHATEADCSLVNSGSGDSGSPLYVNHKPTLNSASTTANFKDPGQQVTLTATSTDTDAQGGYDELYVSFCSSNSWATSTGCVATTLCSATTTAAAGAVGASCNYTLPSPLADTSYSYYAFVKDWHTLPANANGATSTYTVNNVSPVVNTVWVNGGLDIYPNMKNSASTTASSSAQVTDNNGCADVNTASSTIYWSGVSGGANCSANNNGCYQINTTSCTKTPGCSGAIANFVCTTTVAYYVNSTDATSTPRQGDDWRARVTVSDEALATSSISVTGVEVISVLAIDVTENLIDYQTVRSGDNTGTSNATTTVVNFGNTPINSDVYGTDMVGPSTIGADNQKFNATTTFDWASAGTTLASTTPKLAAINVNKPTGSDLSSPIYWGIGIPSGKPSGNYGGTNTFVAILYSGGSW